MPGICSRRRRLHSLVQACVLSGLAILFAGSVAAPTAVGSAALKPERELMSSSPRESSPPAKGLNTLGLLAIDQGWWVAWGEHFPSNQNYLVGYAQFDAEGGGPSHFRNYFTFDLGTALTKPVIFARLDVYSEVLTGNPTETLGLYDVTTSPKVLDGEYAAGVYSDLGTGQRYGLHTIDTDLDERWLTLELNRAALRDINQASRYFSVGGSLLSINEAIEDGYFKQYLFGYSGDVRARLVLRVAPSGK